MRVLILVAVVCIAVAFLGAVHLIDGVNVLGWFLGGMLAWVVDIAAGDRLVLRRRV